MSTNELFLALGAGLIVFIIVSAYKKSKNEVVDRNETFKISLVVTAIVFGILLVYNKPLEPVLSEPFIAAPSPAVPTVPEV